MQTCSRRSTEGRSSNARKDKSPPSPAAVITNLFVGSYFGRNRQVRTCRRRTWESICSQAAGRDVLLGGVLCRGLLDRWRNNGIVGRNPIRRDIPFFAVPGLDAARPRAFVIDASDLDPL